MSTILDSRWNTTRDKSENDKPVKTDWVYLELLAPGTLRRPWRYQYLTVPYLAALAGRSVTTAHTRIKHLKKDPHYIERADLPKNNNQSLIYNITTTGIRALEEFHDTTLPRVKLRTVQHELMACMIAASFELSGFEIELIDIDLGNVRPDWHPFAIKNDHHHVLCLIEADTGRNSEPVESDDPERSSIAHKFHEYLPLIHAGTLQDTMIFFVTTGNIRVNSMMECLKRIIDKGKYPRHYAKQFAFKKINYSKHFDELPPPTAWAGNDDWLRAGYPVFNFSKPEVK